MGNLSSKFKYKFNLFFFFLCFNGIKRDWRQRRLLERLVQVCDEHFLIDFKVIGNTFCYGFENMTIFMNAALWFWIYIWIICYTLKCFVYLLGPCLCCILIFIYFLVSLFLFLFKYWTLKFEGSWQWVKFLVRKIIHIISKSNVCKYMYGMVLLKRYVKELPLQ